jgi:hypothetical protein
MLWNGSKHGKNQRNDNLKATNPAKITTDQKHVGNVEHFNYLGTMITNDARCEVISKTVKANAAFNIPHTRKLDLNSIKKLVK